jgi:AcrR family transcriptional regulator
MAGEEPQSEGAGHATLIPRISSGPLAEFATAVEHYRRRMATGRRERLLDAALDAFGELGIEGTSISEVERRAGLTAGTGSFYRHFPDKDALIEAAVQHEVTRCLEEISTARAHLPAFEDPVEQQRAMLELALADLRRFDRLIRLALSDGDRVPALREAVSVALADPDLQMPGATDRHTILTLSALGGYHLFSLLQGRPFQGVVQEEFIEDLLALAPRRPPSATDA